MGIELSHIEYFYGTKHIFEDFSYTFPDTGVVCLFGPSGCGKTTLLKILCGLRKPQKGQLAGLPQKPAVVFQEDRLLPWYTAEENVEFVGKNALQWLQFVGLEKEAKLYPKELSGGMQRRVALARAFSMEYDTLLLDEPFTGLDEESIKKIAEHIREVSKNTLVVLVTHKKEEADLLQAQMLYL